MGLACHLVVVLLQSRSILCRHPVNVLSLWCFVIAATVSFGRPYASRICSIFPLWMESKALVKSTRHCWRSKDELISDVLLWTPIYGRAKAGRPARTYIRQLCEETGCSSEDLPEATHDREKWRERVRDIRAGGTTWWWCIKFHSNVKLQI